MLGGSLWDLLQNRQIRRNQSDIARTRYQAGNARTDVEALERDHERLKLLTLSLWALLKKRTGLTDDDLAQMIEQVDLSDGKRDGRVDSPSTMQACPACNHQVPGSAVTCPYCGQQQQRSELY